MLPCAGRSRPHPFQLPHQQLRARTNVLERGTRVYSTLRREDKKYAGLVLLEQGIEGLEAVSAVGEKKYRVSAAASGSRPELALAGSPERAWGRLAARLAWAPQRVLRLLRST
jgi:hypothetical protein